MRVATSQSGDVFDTPKVLNTPQNYEEGIKLLRDTITELSRGAQIHGIAGGVAGPWNGKEGVLSGSPNLPGWIGKHLVRDLEESFHAPVHINNDSSIVGLGEAVYGSGKGFPIVAYITVSTGVGGARIVDGRIDRSSRGFEPGHQIIDMDKSVVPEAAGNTLEQYVGGKAIEMRMGLKPQEITDESVWDNFSKILAVGIVNTIVYWSPDIVVLGGSMMNKVGIPIESVEKYLKESLSIFPDLPKVVHSSLGDLGGLYGALAYINSQPK